MQATCQCWLKVFCRAPSNYPPAAGGGASRAPQWPWGRAPAAWWPAAPCPAGRPSRVPQSPRANTVVVHTVSCFTILCDKCRQWLLVLSVHWNRPGGTDLSPQQAMHRPC